MRTPFSSKNVMETFRSEVGPLLAARSQSSCAGSLGHRIRAAGDGAGSARGIDGAPVRSDLKVQTVNVLYLWL